ncbi:MAG: hypothetical protein MR616_06700, partial [Pyramidobacter sp.]|nr:hypothetical protein [Pyramidobacter sp.]
MPPLPVKNAAVGAASSRDKKHSAAIPYAAECFSIVTDFQLCGSRSHDLILFFGMPNRDASSSAIRF